MSDRSPEERERARWERDVQRARREGRPEPPPPASLAGDGELFGDLFGREHAAAAASPGAEHAAEVPAGDEHVLEPHEGDGDGGPPTQAWAPVFAEEEHHDEPLGTDEHDVPPVHETPLGTRRGLPSRLHLPHRSPRSELPRAPTIPGSGRRRRGVTVGRIAGAIALLLAVFVAWFLYSLFQPFHGKAKGLVTVRIPAGASANQVGDILDKDGVVSSSFFFSLRATLSGDRSKLGSGTYHLAKDMSYAAALKALTHAPVAPKVASVLLTEGPSIREWAPIVKKDGVTGSYLSAAHHAPPASFHARGARTLEGFLFPDTYTLKTPAKATTLVKDQLDAFRTTFKKIDLTYAHRHGLNTYDVVKIASMVEREAATKHDRPLVAAVIYNRLHLGMTLGIDATLRYKLNFWQGQLTQSQLASHSAYNTRLHKGLPPTPIGNPGLSSLEAAAHPAKVSYLYYVAQPGACNQAFSTSYSKFLANQRRYQQALAKKHGSPTKC